jgi:hypothetical protein
MDIRIVILYVTAEIRHLAKRVREEGDRGDAAEKVITIAAMTALALAVMAVIAAKVSSKADSITF